LFAIVAAGLFAADLAIFLRRWARASISSADDFDIALRWSEHREQLRIGRWKLKQVLPCLRFSNSGVTAA